MPLTGPEKAVLMLLSLDEASAAPIVGELDEADLRKLREVAAMMRVWKLYGSRPDITKKVRNWRALVALTSTLLREPVRREFETKILAGENVTAATIAAKASRAQKTGRPSKAAMRATGR